MSRATPMQALYRSPESKAVLRGGFLSGAGQGES
jgi:hypothetical protein